MAQKTLGFIAEQLHLAGDVAMAQWGATNGYYESADPNQVVSDVDKAIGEMVGANIQRQLIE